MASKKIKSLNDLRGIVYSTDPNFKPFEAEHEGTNLPASKQPLRIWYEHKHRGGKAVTVVKGFNGDNEVLEALGRKLKQACGTGGAVKDGEILVQGDHRPKVLALLQKEGYTSAKLAGG